jgi:hypothetical protein
MRPWTAKWFSLSAMATSLKSVISGMYPKLEVRQKRAYLNTKHV